MTASHFPHPILPPEQVHEMRRHRNQQVIRSATLGVGIRAAIIIFELIGVVLFNSSALFMDAISSLMDVISTLFLILCMKLAQRPPDEDHPFGHGRYEPLGGLLLGLLLTVMGSVMLIRQIADFSLNSLHPSIHPFTWLFPFIAMLLLEGCYRFIIYIAKKENSPALAVDAIHYRMDGLTSLLATVALLLAAYFPIWSVLIDQLGAIMIACFMIIMGLYGSKDNLHQLLDRVPPQPFFEKVRAAALQVRGVKGTEKIRIQSYGPDAHVDIDIEVEPQLSVDVAHRISQQVRAEIQKSWPAVRDVTVHVEPYYENDH